MANDAAAAAPLAAYEGAKPAAPQWFQHAVAAIPAPEWIDADGSRIETYVWGRPGAPGLLFLHGNLAHAGWWNFLAPAFAERYRIASFSWSGMGQSTWRRSYSLDRYVTEALTVAETTGLFASSTRPVLVAHSFGGRVTTMAARVWGQRLSGCIIVDSRMLHLPASRSMPRGLRYPSLAAALSRFRFAPAQTCEHAFIADYLARGSLMQLENSSDWTWRFDPVIGPQLGAMIDETPLLHLARCPLAFIYGSRSTLTAKDVQQRHRAGSTPGTIQLTIENAAHHVMVDQPHALVDSINSVLRQWRLD